MLRANNRMKLTALTFITTLLTAATATAQSSWKLYDLRDLIDLLPEASQVEAATSANPAAYHLGGTPPAPAKPPPEPVEALMDAVCSGLGLVHLKLSAGIYGIEADEEAHSTLLRILKRVRELYAERYEVQIVWYSVAPTEAPNIGDPITPAEPFHRHHFVAVRRTPTELAQTTRNAYVANIQPVVASGAVGYGLDVRRAETGFRASIMVGAGHESETETSIHLKGDLRYAAMGKVAGPLKHDQERRMQIELPAVSSRSIQSTIWIEFGKLTALGVVGGLDNDECIVVAGLVRKLED